MKATYKNNITYLYIEVNQKGNIMTSTLILAAITLILGYIFWIFVIPLLVGILIFIAKALVVITGIIAFYWLLKKLR